MAAYLPDYEVINPADLNEALDALADSVEVARKGDCALEADWADEAEALGADKELISWVRALAERYASVRGRRDGRRRRDG